MLLWIFGTRVIYHEHDTPARHQEVRNGRPCALLRFLEGARRRIAKEAELCVLPNEGRAARFRSFTGTTRPLILVRNFPLRAEALPPWKGDAQMIIHYHGNIGPELVPLTVIEALASVPEVHLRIIGYTTLGCQAFPTELMRAAEKWRVSSRVVILPAMPRAALFGQARRACVGLSLMPMESSNPNFVNMAGASNKAFDYLACGLPLLVSDLAEWNAMFVHPGFARPCDPRQAASIARALRWFVGHKSTARSMGESGRQRVLNDWNYEKAFAQVLNFAGFAQQVQGNLAGQAT